MGSSPIARFQEAPANAGVCRLRGQTRGARGIPKGPSWYPYGFAHGVPASLCRTARELERQSRLLTQGVEELREGLGRELSLDERLKLVAEQHALERLLDQIERRRFA